MGISLKVSYIITIPGILKIVEIVVFLLAFSCGAGFSNGEISIRGYQPVSITAYYGSASKVSYFVGISVITWIYCLIHFFACLFGLYDSITFFFKSIIVGVIHGVLAFLVLVGASVAASYVGDIKDNVYACGVLGGFSNTSCETLEAAAAFGFLGMIALIVDAVWHIVKGRSGGNQQSSSNEKEAPPV